MAVGKGHHWICAQFFWFQVDDWLNPNAEACGQNLVSGEILFSVAHDLYRHVEPRCEYRGRKQNSIPLYSGREGKDDPVKRLERSSPGCVPIGVLPRCSFGATGR